MKSKIKTGTNFHGAICALSMASIYAPESHAGADELTYSAVAKLPLDAITAPRAVAIQQQDVDSWFTAYARSLAARSAGQSLSSRLSAVARVR